MSASPNAPPIKNFPKTFFVESSKIASTTDSPLSLRVIILLKNARNKTAIGIWAIKPHKAISCE